jgi:Fic-DOC domain mobile mystery protein B
MKQIYFNDRDGQTVLSSKERGGVLLKHISNMKELDEAEQLNIQKGLLWLMEKKPKTILSERFFKQFHKQLFGEVWSWAGSFRTSEKNIGIDYWGVPTAIHTLCEDCKVWIKHKSYPWPELIARFHHELVSIHPWPNGNGRFSRILTNYLCDLHKQPRPSWHDHLPPEKRRDAYIDALRAADVRDFDPLIEFMKRVV